MSDERAERLRASVADAAWELSENPKEDVLIVLRAVVEELGLTWEMVYAARVVCPSGQHEMREAQEITENLNATADALATLLDAAGVER